MLIPLLLSLVAGLTTLIGGLMVVFLKKLKPIYLSISLGFAAGVMVFICFDELLPQAYERGNSHSIIFGIFAGMAVMAFSLYLL